MADLTPLTRDALDRAMRAAHWHRLASDVYERRMTRHFAVGAQYWIEGAGVEVETLISMRCPRADMALVDLGADDADSAVTRSPLDHAVTIECADQIEAAVAGLV